MKIEIDDENCPRCGAFYKKAGIAIVPSEEGDAEVYCLHCNTIDCIGWMTESLLADVVRIQKEDLCQPNQN